MVEVNSIIAFEVMFNLCLQKIYLSFICFYCDYVVAREYTVWFNCFNSAKEILMIINILKLRKKIGLKGKWGLWIIQSDKMSKPVRLWYGMGIYSIYIKQEWKEHKMKYSKKLSYKEAKVEPKNSLSDRKSRIKNREMRKK